MENIFLFKGQNEIPTPQLVINRKQLDENIDRVIGIAGGTDRLWPHVKTHKCGAVTRMMAEKGITRFKCATIAECEMAAENGGKDILLAYPAVGPTIRRLLDVSAAFPSVQFYGLFDDIGQLRKADKECRERGMVLHVFVDVNTGLDRTGIQFSQVPEFWREGSALSGIVMTGLHCYDGQRHESDRAVRKAETEKTYAMTMAAVSKIERKSGRRPVFIMGGTPSFPCYAEHDDAGLYMSPGTLFINDAGYSENYQDLAFPPAAAVFTRVISNPLPGHFTLDLGCKGIASDPSGSRGRIIGLEHAVDLFQNEEHWAWKMEKGYEGDCPKVGDGLFVVPTHICPTSALYPFSVAVEDGKKVAEWTINARNRKITY